MAATNSAFRAEPSYENHYNHIELFNRQSIPGEAPAAIQTYQEEAANQTYEANDRTVATNNAFRAESNDEHLYNHLDLFNRQSMPSGAPAANQTYQGNAIPQEATKIIARGRRERSFAMIAVLVLSFLAMVAASICLAMMTISTDDRVDSGWSLWSPWGPCSVTCGGGNQNRVRDCTNSPPSRGRNACLGRRVESQACNPQNCSNCWIKMNASPVCFGARDDRFGTFDVPFNGKLASVKLVHLHGYVTCNDRDNSTWSFWGCGRYKSKQVNVLITTTNEIALLPSSDYFIYRTETWSLIPGYMSLSPELVLSAFSNPPLVTRGQKLRLWYGEDFQIVVKSTMQEKRAVMYMLA